MSARKPPRPPAATASAAAERHRNAGHPPRGLRCPLSSATEGDSPWGRRSGSSWPRSGRAGRKLVEAQLPVKVGRKAPGGGFVGAFYSGAWLDDGDGIPEDPATSDDAYECTGFTLTSFRVRGKVDLSPVRAERLRSLVP